VIGKIDVDANNQATSFFQIRGIPTVLIFKNGELVDQLVGVHPKSKYSEVLNKALE
jgi:thioredoxin 1